MKNRIILLALAVLLAALLGGCGMSKEQIAETVRTSMQQNIDNNDAFKDLGMTVGGVQVLKQGSNHYQGIADVILDGETHQVPIDITVDGKQVMWKAEPGAFAFVIQKKLKSLFQ